MDDDDEDEDEDGDGDPDAPPAPAAPLLLTSASSTSASHRWPQPPPTSTALLALLEDQPALTLEDQVVPRDAQPAATSLAFPHFSLSPMGAQQESKFTSSTFVP
ncbi:hypothetical protein DUI87_17920 [Hirundo rustica rustica]|uniref:Uncharacterized protein n=1 Tax=Hirundo rustica rustica TaxID=333673 RepID=A0A3M0JV17_HIRRU|nr:hypothetical protein DUI87_17920 [Hirundo rustica rustica]